MASCTGQGQGVRARVRVRDGLGHSWPPTWGMRCTMHALCMHCAWVTHGLRMGNVHGGALLLDVLDLLTTYNLLLTTYNLLLTTDYVLLTTYYLLLTTYLLDVLDLLDHVEVGGTGAADVDDDWADQSGACEVLDLVGHGRAEGEGGRGGVSGEKCEG